MGEELLELLALAVDGIGVLSTWKVALLTPVTVLPATSVQLSEVTFCVGPSPLVVLDWTLSPPALSGKLARQAALRPEPEESVALKVLVTSVLYQPAALGWAVGPRSLIEGALVSIFTVSVFGPLGLPALSLTAQLMLWVSSPETLAV